MDEHRLIFQLKIICTRVITQFGEKTYFLHRIVKEKKKKMMHQESTSIMYDNYR